MQIKSVEVVINGMQREYKHTYFIFLADVQLELEGQRLKDLNAKNYLFQAIDSSILQTILSKTSKQIWDSMKG